MAEATNHSPAAPPLDLLTGAALFLDFDGTLVELAPTPDGVSVSPRLTRLLDRLTRILEGRVAIVSGRPVALLRKLLPIPMLTVGSHGMEFGARDGAIDIAVRPEALDMILSEMHELAAGCPGVIVENKPLGAALHYRQSPHAEQACVDLARALADRHDLHLQPGKLMIEVRAPGGDKGTAIERLMREPDMRGAIPLFMGDDLTDEPGFAAAAGLGGAGILVGAERPTEAQYRLESVAEALAWLEKASA